MTFFLRTLYLFSVRFIGMLCAALALVSAAPKYVLAHPSASAHGNSAQVNYFDAGLSHGFFHTFGDFSHELWLNSELAFGLDLAILSLGMFLIFSRSRQYSAMEFRRLTGFGLVLIAGCLSLLRA